ncbi:MAG: hypothetical protein KGL39_04600 [Patescibacteria group bacterium]|nr:hypothetical protein [Patescibacteria group bacterium]
MRKLFPLFLLLLASPVFAANATYVQGPGAAGTPVGGVLTVQGASSGGNIPVTLSACTPISSSALAANLVVKASAGALCSFNVSADSTLSGAAWWVMVYNATSAPADGSVTPLKCYALPLGATGITASFSQPVTASTGITIGVSTNGCFTKAASTHAFISGDFQ